MQSNQEKINKASEKLKKDNEKIATLSEETRKKSEELKKIAKEKGTDNYEYELKAKELDRLGDEIDRIANSEDYKNNWREFEINFDNIDKVFNSEEFKNQFKFDGNKLKELKMKLSRPDLKDAVIKIRKLKSPENLDMQFPEPPIPPMNFEIFDAPDKSKLSKDEIKALEKLSKERAKLSKEQAELAKKQAEIAKKQAEISRKYAQNNPWVIGIPEPKKGKLIIVSEENYKNADGKSKKRIINKNSCLLYTSRCV